MELRQWVRFSDVSEERTSRDIYTIENDGTTIFRQRGKRFPSIAASYVRTDSQHTCRVHGINLSTKNVDSIDTMKIVPGYFTSCSKLFERASCLSPHYKLPRGRATTHIHTYIHTYTHIHTHAYIHTHIHKHIHTHSSLYASLVHEISKLKLNMNIFIILYR
jgi:hypothetical protein